MSDESSEHSEGVLFGVPITRLVTELDVSEELAELDVARDILELEALFVSRALEGLEGMVDRHGTIHSS